MGTYYNNLSAVILINTKTAPLFAPLYKIKNVIGYLTINYVYILRIVRDSNLPTKLTVFILQL